MARKQKNPLRELRGRLGATRSELALRTGVEYGVLTRVELGLVREIPANVLALFEDQDAAQRAYQRWRDAQREPIRATP